MLIGEGCSKTQCLRMVARFPSLRNCGRQHSWSLYLVQIDLAKRLGKLPPYLFAELDRLKKEVQAKGVDVISLGIGDPDLPTPDHIVTALKRSSENPVN